MLFVLSLRQSIFYSLSLFSSAIAYAKKLAYQFIRPQVFLYDALCFILDLEEEAKKHSQSNKL